MIINIFLISQLLLCLIVCYKLYNSRLAQLRLSADLEKEIVRLTAHNEYLLQQNSEIKQHHEKAESDLKLYFENYANNLLKAKSDILQSETQINLNHILLPLKEKITEFQSKVEATYQNEAREIFSLKNEIGKLLANNVNMLKETENLTNALKGNVKAQGIWGELILDKILESSGLRKGIEYITQGTDLDLKTEDNKALRPDVIINLPDNKHLIIDAKVSLVHYEQYIASSAQRNEPDQQNLSLFIKSIQNHISNLSSKNYQFNEKLLSPDFVMLFFPIEGAFSLALQTMPDLLLKAWQHKIIIVSPTTLFATLKTIASIWLFEKQNKNAMKIATESGLLYDKLVLFTEDLTKVGQAIIKADEAYHQAVNKLSSGRGNIITKTEKIRQLGAKTKKKLADDWLEDNLDDMDEDTNPGILVKED